MAEALWLCSSDPVPEVEDVLEASRIPVRRVSDPKALTDAMRGSLVIVAGKLGPYGPEQAAQLLVEHGARVILLHESLDAPMVRRAWRTGVAEVLFVPTELPQLPNVLHRLLNIGLSPLRSRIAIAGVHGGAGATLLAVGVAAAAAMQGRHTALLSWCIGWQDTGALLGVDHGRDLGELTDVLSEITPAHIQDVANPSLPGLDLLAGQPVAPHIGPWSDDVLSILMANASLAWDVVVADVGDVRRPGLLAGLHDVEALWVVVPATVPSLRQAALSLPASLGSISSRVGVILNRCGSRDAVATKLAQERLTFPVVAEINEVREALDDRWLKGQALTAKPRSTLMRDFWQVATRIPK